MIKITQDKKGLFSVETEGQIADRLYWHEMIALIARITEPADQNECFSWLKNKDLFNS